MTTKITPPTVLVEAKTLFEIHKSKTNLTDDARNKIITLLRQFGSYLKREEMNLLANLHSLVT